MNCRKTLKDDAGFILMPLLLVMGLVSLAAGGALLSGQLDLRATARLKTAIQAFYIAEAGLNHGWDELQNNDGVNDFPTVTGASTSGAPLRPYLPVSPCGPPYSSGVGITGGVYDPATGQLRGSGAVPIVLVPGSYCFSSIDLSGGVSALAVSGPVTISLTAHSLLTGGGIENPTLVAENLKIFSSVSSAKGGLDIAGGALVYMAVYAPNARVVVSGSGDLYGSVVGATVSAAAGAKFHYDKRLKDNQDGGIVMVTWREIF